MKNPELSKREAIAVEAMRAIIAKNPAVEFKSEKDAKNEAESVALGAFAYADAMLAVSEKTAPKTRRITR